MCNFAICEKKNFFAALLLIRVELIMDYGIRKCSKDLFEIHDYFRYDYLNAKMLLLRNRSVCGYTVTRVGL